MNITKLCYDNAGINVVHCYNYKKYQESTKMIRNIICYIVLGVSGLFFLILLRGIIHWKINQRKALKLLRANEEDISNLAFQKMKSTI